MTIIIFWKYHMIEGFIQKLKNYIENCTPPGLFWLRSVFLTDEFVSRSSKHWARHRQTDFGIVFPLISHISENDWLFPEMVGHVMISWLLPVSLRSSWSHFSIMMPLFYNKPLFKMISMDSWVHFEPFPNPYTVYDIHMVPARGRGTGTEADAGWWRTWDGSFSSDTSASRTEADQGPIKYRPKRTEAVISP